MQVQVFGMAAFRDAVGQGIELAERASWYVADSPVLELLSRDALASNVVRVRAGASSCA